MQAIASDCEGFGVFNGFRMAFEVDSHVFQAHTYYHKHVEHCRSSGREASGYLKSPDAAYTFAFSVILLNSDQHNRKLKKRMSLKDLEAPFLSFFSSMIHI